MSENLQVIALISGGKDSFFSLLRCRQNGHKVVALGNLYPATEPPGTGFDPTPNQALDNEDDEHDLNSFMYQTVGHTVIPLYAQALGIPLYRQPIVGSAIQTGTSYGHSDVASEAVSISNLGSIAKTQLSGGGEEDETESLVPLLKRIMAEHPTANALSTGAILSTYQRTRIESVALRLGLTPLAYLWKYPILPPESQSSLLEDMQAVRLDARIIKIASGGLDESFLWENVASQRVVQRIERSMKKFGTYGDGAVLGEGGEFETLVVDGPASLFQGRIEVQERDRRIIREGGGSSWLKILNAKVVMNDSVAEATTQCRVPDLLDPRFSIVFNTLSGEHNIKEISKTGTPRESSSQSSNLLPLSLSSPRAGQGTTICWTISADQASRDRSIIEEAAQLTTEIRQQLHRAGLTMTNIISTIIILRSMDDFAPVNKVYGTLFTAPNPPARVTISCGDLVPEDINILIHLKVHNPSPSSPPRKALHVQSRSYWAPANIGPYSQAISIPLSVANEQDQQPWVVSVAGQIPLIPHTMSLPVSEHCNAGSSKNELEVESFKKQTVLSLQHLWRIGQEMNVQWWSSAVAYLPRSTLETIAEKAAIVSRAWALIHARDVEEDSESEEVRDLWEEKHYAGMEVRGAGREKKMLPDWEVIGQGSQGQPTPPFWVVEVEELPRGSAVEWHAQLGVLGAIVKLLYQTSDEGWSVDQCSFGGVSQWVVMIDYFDEIPEFLRRLAGAFKVLGAGSEVRDSKTVSYLDVSIEGMQNVGNIGGKIPCRSIWAASGKRLAAVLVIDSW